MLSKIYSSGIFGIEGFEVAVECSAWDRIPRFDLVGLPDAAVKEAKNRVQSACENSGFKFPALDSDLKAFYPEYPRGVDF